MKLDHPRVASGPELDPNACRIETLLDEEILPRLERPARCLGPLEPHGLAHSPADSTRFVLVWPSVLESHALPDALRPLSDALRERHGALAHFASVPALDLAHELRQRGLPLTSRPFHRPIAEYGVWLVWMRWPHQVFGLLTLLDGCGLASRARDRAADAPRILVAGPAAASAIAALRPFADAVLTSASVSETLDLLDTVLTRAPFPREELASLAGAEGSVVAPPGPVESPRPDSVDADERSTVPWLVQAGDLASPLVERTMGALGGRLSIVRAWSASERLRAAWKLPDGDTLLATVRAEFAVSSEVAIEIAVGLPDERAEDRAAIVPFARRLLKEAPHSPKQLLIKLGPYLAAGPESSGSAAAWRERLEKIATDLRGRKIRCEVGDPACAWTGALVATATSDDASVLEQVHAAGARVGESALACQPDLWHKAWQAKGVAGQEPDDDALSSARERSLPTDAPLWRRITAVTEADDPGSTAVAATGLPAEDGRAGATAPASPARGNGKSSRDRWTRWQALAPRQFDYRLEFAKRGPMRFVGHRELWSMWVGAIAAAELPLATSGLAQPRPKITFGPPLPLGVEGLQEYVDVSLTRKISDLRQTLNDRFPAGLSIQQAAFIPAVAGRVSLGMVTRTDYQVRVRPGHCSSGSLPTLAVEARARRLVDPTASAAALIQRDEATIDLRTQIATLSVREDPEGVLIVTFSLDLTPEGPKARPQDVLAYLLADEVRDLRTLPIQRLRLLVPRDESGGPLLTPMEQVRLADRTLRARAKMCD